MGGLLRPRRRAVPTKPDSAAPAVTPAPWDLDRRLAESLARESALAEVLRLMSRTPLDLQAVLDTIVQRAAELCTADRDGSLFLVDGELIATHPLGAHEGSTASMASEVAGLAFVDAARTATLAV